MASKHLIVLGDRDMAAGMRLAGVREAYVVDKGNVNEIYGKVKDSAALFLITKEVAELLGPRVEELRSRTLVQVIPESIEHYSVVKNMIKDTVGFDLGV
jgi:vacuolar-type H+-ATPase subunit F/Vma7